MARKKKEKGHLKPRDFIRLAIKDDCVFIRNLSGEAFSTFGDYNKIIPRWFVNPNVVTVTYVKHGNPAGFAMLNVVNGEILAIAVLPAHQRKGIGSALLNYIGSLASQLGITKVTLHTATENNTGRLFFQKLGFEAIGFQEDYYPKGQQAVVFSKGI